MIALPFFCPDQTVPPGVFKFDTGPSLYYHRQRLNEMSALKEQWMLAGRGRKTAGQACQVSFRPIMKTTLPLLLGLLLLAAPAAVQAQLFLSGNFWCNNNGDGTATIAGYSAPAANVAIPPTLSGLTVTTIDFDAFDGDAMTSVSIPSTVTNIGLAPFYSCESLTTITVDPANLFYCSVSGVLFDANTNTLIQFPGGVAGNYAIPGTVTNIASYAFDDCTNLAGITIPASVTRMGEEAFENCTSLTNATIFNGVAGISGQAFYGCGRLTGITIPASVTYIGGTRLPRAG